MFTASAKDLKANSTDRSDAVQHASRVEEATACSSTRLAQCTGKIVTVQLSSKVAVVADCWRCRNNGIRLQRRDSCPTTGERKNAAQGAVPECVLTQWSNRSDQKQPNKWTSGNAVWCRFSALLHYRKGPADTKRCAAALFAGIVEDGELGLQEGGTSAARHHKKKDGIHFWDTHPGSVQHRTQHLNAPPENRTRNAKHRETRAASLRNRLQPARMIIPVPCNHGRILLCLGRTTPTHHQPPLQELTDSAVAPSRTPPSQLASKQCPFATGFASKEKDSCTIAGMNGHCSPALDHGPSPTTRTSPQHPASTTRQQQQTTRAPTQCPFHAGCASEEKRLLYRSKNSRTLRRCLPPSPSHLHPPVPGPGHWRPRPPANCMVTFSSTTATSTARYPSQHPPSPGRLVQDAQARSPAVTQVLGPRTQDDSILRQPITPIHPPTVCDFDPPRCRVSRLGPVGEWVGRTIPVWSSPKPVSTEEMK